MKKSIKKGIWIVSLLFIFATESYSQTDFVVENGALSWGKNCLTAGFVQHYSGQSYLCSPSGAKLVRLDNGTSWKNHTVNGDTTTSVLDFQNKLLQNGFGYFSDSPKLPFYQDMDTIGDGTGRSNMNVDGTDHPDTFRIKPNQGEIINISRLITTIKDEGTFDSGGWGNNGGYELDSGIRVVLKRKGVEYEMVKDRIKSHFDLASMSYDISLNEWGQGEAFLVNRFTFKNAGQYIVLNGDYGDEFMMIITDDLSYITIQKVSVQGYYSNIINR